MGFNMIYPTTKNQKKKKKKKDTYYNNAMRVWITITVSGKLQNCHSLI